MGLWVGVRGGGLKKIRKDFFCWGRGEAETKTVILSSLVSEF